VLSAGWFLHDDARVLRLAPTPLPTLGASAKNSSSWLPWLDGPSNSDTWIGTCWSKGGDPAALSDWVAVSGAASLPRWQHLALPGVDGITYNATSFVDEVLEGFAQHDVPLSMAILDMDW